MQIHLKELRMQKGISIRELSRLAGVSKGSIEKMEGESPNPRVETICKVASALNVSLSELITNDAE